MTEDRFPKLLVLGASLPGGRDGGGVVRDEILRRYPRGRYVCCSVERPSWPENRVPESMNGIPWMAAPLVPRLRLRGARYYMPLVRWTGFHVAAPRRVRQMVTFGKQHKAELVWAELQYDALLVAKRVADGLGVPFAGTVWDDPEGWFTHRGYDAVSRAMMRDRFAEALHSARGVSTAGEKMQETYRQEYGVESVILRHGFERPARQAQRTFDRDEIIVGFVGSAYGQDAWAAFLSAVARLNRSHRLPTISLRVFGGGPFRHRCEDVHIEVRGWQPAERMLDEIAETDFCYLAYWFEPAKRRHVALSFANKLETYIAAGRPVLFHAPAYAGMGDAIRKYGLGVCVHSLEPRELCDAMERLATDAQLRSEMSRSAATAFRAEFNASVMMRNFAELIGMERTAFEEVREPALSGVA